MAKRKNERKQQQVEQKATDFESVVKQMEEIALSISSSLEKFDKVFAGANKENAKQLIFLNEWSMMMLQSFVNYNVNKAIEEGKKAGKTADEVGDIIRQILDEFEIKGVIVMDFQPEESQEEKGIHEHTNPAWNLFD